MTIESLQKKTDEELIALLRAGNADAMEILLCRYRGFVKSCAHHYFLVGGETEDLVQEGMIGLYSAVQNYDSERGCSFRSFAYRCIHSQIRDAVKKAAKTSMAIAPLPDYVPERGMSPEDILILQDEQKEFRQKMSEALSDFEFKVTTMYMDGMSIVEICAATGKSYKSVDNALQRSKRKLLQMIFNK